MRSRDADPRDILVPPKRFTVKVESLELLCRLQAAARKIGGTVPSFLLFAGRYTLAEHLYFNPEKLRQLEEEEREGEP